MADAIHTAAITRQAIRWCLPLLILIRKCRQGGNASGYNKIAGYGYAKQQYLPSAATNNTMTTGTSTNGIIFLSVTESLFSSGVISISDGMQTARNAKDTPPVSLIGRSG